MSDLSIPEGGRDILTPRVASILREAGEAGYTRLVVSGPPPAVSQSLRGVSPEQLFARPIKHGDDAAAALAGLWLWHQRAGRVSPHRAGHSIADRQPVARDHAPPRGGLFQRQILV